MKKGIKIFEFEKELLASTLNKEKTIECYVETYLCKKGSPNFEAECREYSGIVEELDDKEIQERIIFDEDINKKVTLAEYIENLKETEFNKFNEFEEFCCVIAYSR